VLALIIACIGLYGTMAYTVARRTGEIGIRMALGAKRASIVAMVLREVFALTAAGVALGLALAWGTTRFVESFLFGLKHNDPIRRQVSAIWQHTSPHNQRCVRPVVAHQTGVRLNSPVSAFHVSGQRG
jgi:ABC-type antimicrobial peptide transport system permease subunit